jgi:hypothetical protein
MKYPTLSFDVRVISAPVHCDMRVMPGTMFVALPVADGCYEYWIFISIHCLFCASRPRFTYTLGFTVSSVHDIVGWRAEANDDKVMRAQVERAKVP